MSDNAELLERLGTDAVLWAKEFRETAIRLGYSDMDEGLLIAWFANAIEWTDMKRCNPLRSELAAEQNMRRTWQCRALEAEGALEAELDAAKEAHQHYNAAYAALRRLHAAGETYFADNNAVPIYEALAAIHDLLKETGDE